MIDVNGNDGSNGSFQVNESGALFVCPPGTEAPDPLPTKPLKDRLDEVVERGFEIDRMRLPELPPISQEQIDDALAVAEKLKNETARGLLCSDRVPVWKVNQITWNKVDSQKAGSIRTATECQQSLNNMYARAADRIVTDFKAAMEAL